MKTLILTVATAALLSMTTFGSTAEAGGKRHFRFNAFDIHDAHNRAAKRRKVLALRKARLIARRKAKIAAARRAKIRKAKIAALKKAKIAEQRRIAARLAAAERREQEVNNTEQADIVNAEEVAGVSTIIPTSTTTDADIAEEAYEDNNRQLSCKKFIPTAGMTITVPCQG